jgi:hypothetical protein
MNAELASPPQKRTAAAANEHLARAAVFGTMLITPQNYREAVENNV